MASSGTIKSWVLNTGSISGNSCKGAYYSFEWSSQSAGAGVTLVSWNLYGRGRTSSPTKLENGIHLDVVANGTTTRLYTLDDSDGTAQTSFKNYLRTSGSFYVYHGSDGSGSFTINMNVKIYTGTWHYTSETAYLDANYLPTYTVTQYHYYEHVRNGWTHFNTTTDTRTSGTGFAPYNVSAPTGYYAGNNYTYYRSSDSASLGSGTVGTNSFTVDQNITVHVHYYPNSYPYDMNIYLPNGDQPYTTGTAGSVEFSINGGSYVRAYNEQASSYPYDSSFHFRNFTPGTGLYLSSTGGLTANSDGTWSGTQPAETINHNFYTSYATYTNYIVHWKYVGTGGDNGDGSLKNMGTTSFTGTYGSAVTIPSDHIQSYPGYSHNSVAGSYWGTSSWGGKTIGTTFTQPAGSVNIEYYYYPNDCVLDIVNGIINSSSTDTIEAAGTCDVYINGSLVGQGVTDWYESYPYGTTYEIKNIQPKPGYIYCGPYDCANSGTLTGDITGWQIFEGITYNVWYNGNGASSGSVQYSSHQYGIAKKLNANAFSRSYTVTYDANGGTCSKTSDTGTSTFAGWATSCRGSAVYSDQQTVSNLRTIDTYHPFNLFAKWSGGSFTLPTPTRTGYTFRGWKPSNPTIDDIYIQDAYSKSLCIGDFSVHFYSYDDMDEQYEGGRYYETFVAYDYLPDASGNIVPVIYKTHTWNDEGELNEPYLPDFEEPFYYVGKETVNGVTYDVWRKSYNTNDSMYCSVYTDEIVHTDGGPAFTGSYLPCANITLKATWTPDYIIQFNGNGHTGGSLPTTIQKSGTSTATVMGDIGSSVPTRTGYVFRGWSASSTYGTKRIAYSTSTGGDADYSGTSATIATSSWTYATYCTNTGGNASSTTLTLYAQWEKSQYTVTYNANGGTSSTLPANQTKTHDVTLTLSNTKPTRADSTTTYTVTLKINDGSNATYSTRTATRTTRYTFSKWNTASGGTGTNYSAGGSYTANANVTLYAQWSSSASTTTVTLPTPTRTGYTFRGWSTSNTSTSGTTGSYTPIRNVTLYAIWAKNQITVNLRKDDGAWSASNKVVSLIQSGNVVESLTASSGSAVVFSSGTYSGTYQVRVTGYSANYTSSSFTATYTSSQTINFYTLTCVAGTGISSASGSGVYYSGESASITATVRTGYTWSSWSDGNTARSRTIRVNSMQGLTANATPNSYTVQYRSTYGTGSTASSSHTYDINKALTSNGFSRTGYTFLGWSTSPTATSATYTNGQSVKNLSSTNGATVTLYAVWKLNATWDPTLKVYNTTTDVSSVAFGTRMVLTLNTSPSGTFPRYRIVTKIGSTVISDTQGTTETYNNITIPESSLSNVSSMSSSYTCYVVVYAIDAAGTSVLNKTFTFTHTLTEASKPTLTVTTELVDLTGICPGKELGRYTKLLIKPSIQFKYGAVLNEYEIFDPTGKSVYLTQVQNPSNYTTASLDLSAFSGYYSTSNPKLSWTVKVWDSRGQEASATVTQSVKYNIPADVHAYVPYIWSGSAWVKYTPEIASSNSINSSDIYVPFIKD